MKNSSRSGRPDAMKVLADARPDALDPSRPADPARQRTDFARIIADTAGIADTADFLGATGRGHTSPFRRRVGFRPLGAVALAAATATVVVVVGASNSQAPDGSSAAQRHTPTGTHAPSATTTATVPVDGHIELLAAATKAASAPASGTYWQTSTQAEYVDVAEAGSQVFAVHSTSREEWSVGVRQGSGSLMVSGLDSVTEPRTAADRARWRAAGSPGTVRTDVAKASGSTSAGVTRAYTLGAGHPLVMRTNIDDKIYAVGPDNVSYEDLRALPSDVAELRRHLEELYARDNGGDTGSGGRSEWMLRQAGDLVTMPVKPAVRAAAYRVMADLPGVRVVGHSTDRLGREGVAVEFPIAYKGPLGTTRERLVVDPATGAMLSDETVLTTPSARARAAGLKAGTTVDYRATTKMGWGEQQITVPKNARS